MAGTSAGRTDDLAAAADRHVPRTGLAASSNPVHPLLALQRSAGNRATARAVASLRAAAPSPRQSAEPGGVNGRLAVQRTPHWLRDGPGRPHQVVEFAEETEKTVLATTAFVIANPLLGGYVNQRDGAGYIENWLRKWQEFNDAGVVPPLLHAAAGYAIEAVSCFIIKQQAPPAGTVVEMQVPFGSTRPDLVLYDATTRTVLSWLDITASRSTDHVENKAGDWAKVNNAEIIYQSITDVDLAQMRANQAQPDRPQLVDRGNARRLYVAGLVRNIIEERESALRTAHFRDNVLSGFPKWSECPRGWSATKYGTERQRFFADKLGIRATAKQVAAMLYAADVTPSPYFPKTTTQPKPPKVSARVGAQLLAEAAAGKGWPGVTLSDEQRRAVRLAQEDRAFGTLTTHREAAVDDLGEPVLGGGGMKRRRPVSSGGKPPRPENPRPLKRARSDLGPAPAVPDAGSGLG